MRSLLLLVAFSTLSGAESPPTIALTGEINDISILAPLRFVNEAAKQHVPEVVIVIDSHGGSVPSVRLLTSAILKAEGAGTKVTCVAGVAHSAAAILLETCSTRKLRSDGELVFHEAAYEALQSDSDGRLTAGRLILYALLLARDDRAIADMIAPRMHMTADAYLAWISGENRRVQPDEALKRGFVDEVIP